MEPDSWIITALSTAFGALLAVVCRSLKNIRWSKQGANEESKENASTAAEPTPDPELLFIAFLVVCGIAFGVSLTLALIVQQKQPPSVAITLAVCLTGTMVVVGLLLLFVGATFYRTMRDLARRLKVVEGHQIQDGSEEGQISVNRKESRKAGSRQEYHVRADKGTRAIEQAKADAPEPASISPKVKTPPPPGLNTTNRTKSRNSRKKEQPAVLPESGT